MLQQLSRRHINSAEERFSHVTDPFRNEHTPILPQKPSNASYNVVAAFEKLTPITSSQTLLASLTKQPESLFYFENGDDFFCVIVFSISSLVTSETPSLSFSCYLLGYQAILNSLNASDFFVRCNCTGFSPASQRLQSMDDISNHLKTTRFAQLEIPLISSQESIIKSLTHSLIPVPNQSEQDPQTLKDNQSSTLSQLLSSHHKHLVHFRPIDFSECMVWRKHPCICFERNGKECQTCRRGVCQQCSCYGVLKCDSPSEKEQTQYLMEVYAPLCEGIPFDPDNPNKVLPFFSQKSGLYRLDPIDGLFSASSNRRDVPAEKKGTLSALQKRILPLPFHQNE